MSEKDKSFFKLVVLVLLIWGLIMGTWWPLRPKGLACAATYEVPTDRVYKRDPFIPELLPTEIYVMKDGQWQRVVDKSGGFFQGDFVAGPTVVMGYWFTNNGMTVLFAIKVIE